MSTTQATTSVAVTAGGILIQAEVMSLNDASKRREAMP